MPGEQTEGQGSECMKKFFASSVVFSFFCFAATLAIVVFVILYDKVSNTDNMDVVIRLWSSHIRC